MKINDHSGQWAVPHQGQFPINLSIVSDARFFAESLAECLSRDTRLSVGGAFQSWTEALCGGARERLDMLLLDRDLTEGPSAVKLIRGAAPGILIVVIALCETAEEVIAWAEAGVTGYVPKHESLAQLAPLLLRIARGEQTCSASVAASLLHHASERRGPQSAGCSPDLTVREAQIIQLIAAGMSNKDIARHLNIGLPTAKTHVHNLLGKLRLQRRSQAANWMRSPRNGAVEHAKL
jgi:DNA-binding NarL/FixJ family response regulator